MAEGGVTKRIISEDEVRLMISEAIQAAVSLLPVVEVPQPDEEVPVDWESVTGKPTEFLAEPHGHELVEVTGLIPQLAGKAAVEDLAGKADLVALDLKADLSALDLKLDAADLDGKANVSDLALKADVSALAGKADAAAVTTALAAKADTAALADKADASALALKADASALTLKADVAALALKADVAALALKADVDIVGAKADADAVTAALALKADAGALALKADVSALTAKADVAALATKADVSALAAKASNATYRTILNCTGSHTAARAAGTYGLAQGQPLAITGVGTLYALNAIYIAAADFPTVDGLLAKLRLRVQLYTNDVAPTGTYTFGLHPITRPATSGGAGLCIYTIGAAVAGSTAAISAPAADGLHSLVGADFAIPANGHYIIGMVSSAVMPASSHMHASAQLQMRNA